MTAYYNEIDPKAAAWLRELIKAKVIADGHVDERDVRHVRATDLDGFTQCHFFAGIGVWSYALRLAGWSDDEPVWTGSCPCQPFSDAGKGRGFDDERHLWPAWFHLIEECGPRVVFGEQVASKDGLGWLDLVQTDLEATDHAFAAIDLCAAGVGAPHIRQRLWFVAESGRERLEGERLRLLTGRPLEALLETGRGGEAGKLADSARGGCGIIGSPSQQGHIRHADSRGDLSGGLANTDGGNTGTEREQRSGEQRQQPQDSLVGGFWRSCEWLPCRDGKARPVEPGTFPLAHGAPARVGRLRGYGNAIVAEAAAAFIGAYREGACS